MKVFLGNYRHKKNNKKLQRDAQILPATLAEYRAGLKGFIDMYTVVSVCLPLAWQIAESHEHGRALPGLRPDTIDISDRRLVLNEMAFDYLGVIFPGFSAPEVYEGATSGIPTDIYSFTAILYFFLVGVAPSNAFIRLNNRHDHLISSELFLQLTQASELSTTAKEEYDPFESESVQHLPDGQQVHELIDNNFIEILEKGLAIDPINRYHSMTELIATLEPYNTNASIIYPMLLHVDEDRIHDNLVVNEDLTSQPHIDTESYKQDIAVADIETVLSDEKHLDSPTQPDEIGQTTDTVSDITQPESSFSDLQIEDESETEVEMSIDSPSVTAYEQPVTVLPKLSSVETPSPEDDKPNTPSLKQSEPDTLPDLPDYYQKEDELLSDIMSVFAERNVMLQQQNLLMNQNIIEQNSLSEDDQTEASTINDVTQTLDEMWKLIERL
ncbi:MAG: hypothetical protein FWG21_00790 [Oscillospiraceae bacterium]|nr:hypothetical protein [Oscillospiraceae bacterium]